MEIIRGVLREYVPKRCGGMLIRAMARPAARDAAASHRRRRRHARLLLYAKGLAKHAAYSKYERGAKRFVRPATVRCVPGNA